LKEIVEHVAELRFTGDQEIPSVMGTPVLTITVKYFRVAEKSMLLFNGVFQDGWILQS
jgi:hypothetical protein